MGQWYYKTFSFLNECQQGPVNDKQLYRLAIAGKISPGTKIRSANGKNVAWTDAKEFPGLRKAFENGAAKAAKTDRHQASKNGGHRISTWQAINRLFSFKTSTAGA